MKTPSLFRCLLLAAGLARFSGTAAAATLTFDGNTTTAGAQDGSGTWDTTTADWYNGTGDVVWPNATDTAAFGAGTAGTYTITLSNTVNAGAIAFNQSGYTISGGGTIKLNPPAAMTPNFVVTTSASGGTDTISSTLAGTAGSIFTKTGSGTLTISSISGGTAASPTIGIVSGGVYKSAIGGFDSILAFNYGNAFGTAPTSPAIQFLLDSGTLQFTGGSASSSLAANRTVKVSSAGGGIIDPGTFFAAQVLDNAGANTAFYITNPSGAATTFQSTSLISGTGGVTFNGAGTLVFQGQNTYAGRTVVNTGTLELATGVPLYSGGALLSGGSLGNNNVSVAPGATLNLQGGFLAFNLSVSSDRLAIQGNLTTGGVNYVRLNFGNLTGLTPGTYPLATAAGTLNLAGTYQLDGGQNLGAAAPATSEITQFGGTVLSDGNGASTGGMSGGTFYRLTPQPSSNGVQYTITLAPANVINVMPMGSSITEGTCATPNYPGGGYRSILYQLLVNDGRFSPNMEGSNTVTDAATPSGYNVLTGANQLHHEGHGGYQTISDLNNLNANTYESANNNDGGYWLAPGNGVNPDYVTLTIGGNDFGANGAQTTQVVNRFDALATYIQQLRPASNVVMANLFYRAQTTTNASGQTVLVGDLQNTYYNPYVPGIVFNHLLAGQHLTFADTFDVVTPNNNTANIGPDGIHPLLVGYQTLAPVWYNAIASGSAYWTGAQGDGQWSTVTATNGTNFAQNYQLTTPYNTALSSSTDVYFNSNTGPLATTLGQNLTVRGVNFSSGATGPVTIGPGSGGSTLTIGASPSGNMFAGVGGITVQSGSGAHTITANVVLGGPQSVSVSNKQFWGNVSSNTFTVTGVISGNYGLTLTNSYTIYAPTTGTANGSDTTGSVMTQTGTGTAGTTFSLNSNNTYTGGTTISSGTVVVNNSGGSGSGNSRLSAQTVGRAQAASIASGSGTGTGPVSVGQAATLINNGSISGDVTVDGTATGSGTFAGAVTVHPGGAFTGAATINGALTVNPGGLVDVSGGTITVDGAITNNGTLRLEHGAMLAVDGAAAGGTNTPNAARLRTASATAVGGATFVNNGTLDIISGALNAPDGFTNNGVVLDSRVVQAKSASMTGGVMTVTIDSYTGHTYQLQRSNSLDDGSFTNLGALQSGKTGSVLTFQDANPAPGQGFYRVQVDP